MLITRKDPFTGIVNSHDLNISPEEMAIWEEGNTFVQDAFPGLNGDQREFVKTGINIGTFDALFDEDDEDDEDVDVSDDEYLRIKSGEGRDEADAVEEEDDGEYEDCPEFDEMMRLAKDTGCRVLQCLCAMGENDHDYDLALKWLIDNEHYTPENS